MTNNVIYALLVAWRKDESTPFRQKEYNNSVQFLKNRSEEVLLKAELDDLPRRKDTEKKALERELNSHEMKLESDLEYYRTIGRPFEVPSTTSQFTTQEPG